MVENINIRQSTVEDWPALQELYAAAFPHEDLLPLVEALLYNELIALSLVGIVRSTVACHVVFTHCSIPRVNIDVRLLGPLAVTPTLQRQGIGSAVVKNGLKTLQNQGVARVYVLGDPAYYRRFSFLPETDTKPPYPLPAEWTGAWQSISLDNTKEAHICSVLTVPEPWRRPSLWRP